MVLVRRLLPGLPSSNPIVWFRAVDGADLAAVDRVLDRRSGHVCIQGARFRVALTPWLPGADHRRAIETWQRETVAR
jgi:hypothetical protein